jgi:hypothetical protein
MLKFVKSSLIGSLLIAPATVLLAGKPALAVGFSATCTDVHYINGMLYATCKTGKGDTNFAAIRLGDLLANDNGALNWRQDGGFASSCYGIRIEHNRRLKATCPRIDGSESYMDIDLDEKINNLGGNLVEHDIPE